jgi:hypothetical protein
MASVSTTPRPRRTAASLRALTLTIGLLSVGACATSTTSSGANLATTPPRPDPRVGLHAGVMDAGEAAWNLRVLSKTPPSVYACRPNSPLLRPTSVPVSSSGGKNPGKADEAVTAIARVASPMCRRSMRNLGILV